MKRLICICLVVLLLLLASCSAGGTNSEDGETTHSEVGGASGAATEDDWYEEEYGETVDTEPDDTTGSSEFDTEPPFDGVTEDPNYVATEEEPMPSAPSEPEVETETEGDFEGERPIKMYIVGIESVSVYRSESYDSAVVFTLYRGDTVDLVYSNGGWSTILIGGETYYVESDFLSSTPET